MIRNDWTRTDIAELFDLPFTELVLRAAEAHRAHHAQGEVQLCTLLSIKTGGCPEDCGYCSQSEIANIRPQGREIDGRRGGARLRRGGQGGRGRSASAWARRGAS